MERAKRAAHTLATSDNPSDSPSETSTDPSSPWTVEKALSTLPSPPPTSPPTSPIPFLHILERLKTTPREGWRRFGIPQSESIADHMYRMSILTLLCPHPLRTRLNIPRCTLLALVHDMAESLVGDLTPLDNVLKSEKSRRERETMEYLTTHLLSSSPQQQPNNESSSIAGKEIKEAWEEYESNSTLEARFVHDIDKLELVIQMMEYERRGQGEVDLGEFVWVAQKIELEEMREWCRDVLREREAFWKGVGKRPSGVEMAEEVLGKKGGGDGEAEEEMGKEKESN
ncbi:MAG: hypothetical protein Q9220_004843 [cf. Caloplaca sp. 1 TL-2023]